MGMAANKLVNWNASVRSGNSNAARSLIPIFFATSNPSEQKLVIPCGGSKNLFNTFNVPFEDAPYFLHTGVSSLSAPPSVSFMDMRFFSHAGMSGSKILNTKRRRYLKTEMIVKGLDQNEKIIIVQNRLTISYTQDSHRWTKNQRRPFVAACTLR